MSTWLKLLPLELDGINESEFIEPDVALKKTDQQIGTMSEMARRLYTLSRLLAKDANQFNLDAHFCNDKVKKSELVAKSLEFVAKATVIQELVWIGIRDDLGIWDEPIGVRMGFKVVTYPETGDDMPPFIKRIMGLGG